MVYVLDSSGNKVVSGEEESRENFVAEPRKSTASKWVLIPLVVLLTILATLAAVYLVNRFKK